MHDKNWSQASLMELVEYILQHHCRIKAKLLKLQTLLEHAAKLHKDEYSSIGSLQEFFPDFKTKMEDHFASEEQILIPYIRQMDEFDRNRGPKPQIHTSSIKNPISRLEYEHDQTENVMFDKIRTITGNYHLPTGPDSDIKDLYQGLEDIVSNLSEHIHLENNVLFPLAIELELSLMHKK
jgi:regulator of cell morphogenesis and NO signaling